MRRLLRTNRRRTIEAGSKKNGPREEAVRFSNAYLSAVAVDNNRLAIIIAIAITTTLDYHCLVSIPVLTLPDHFTVMVAIAMAGANGHTDATRTNADPDVLRTGRHRRGNSRHRDGSHHKSLDHRMFLSMN